MSATCLRVLSCLAFALAVGLVGSGSTRADDLERIQVASQKALADARAQLTAARKVQASDPDKAKEHLNVAWFHLEDAKAASPAEVRALQNEIQRLLTQVEATLRERSRAAAEAANREAVKKSEQDRRRDLEKPRYGSGGTTKPEDFIKQGRDVLGKYADLKKIREMNVTAIERETMIATADIVEKRFNAARSKWLQENRPEQKLTKEEKHLLKMLNSVMSVDFNKTSLKEAIELIQSKTDLAIFVDDLSLKELELDYDNSQVTFKANKVTVRSILKKVLADKGLTYVIKEAAIHVMTPDRARQHLSTRVYPVADLLGASDPRLGPYLNRVQQLQMAQALMATIVNTIEPASWQMNGGVGTIGFDQVRMAIIITHTAEMHYQLGGGIGGRR